MTTPQGQGGPVDRYPGQWIFQDATGLNTVHITVKPAEDQYPAMVEADPLGTLLPDDAEALGRALIEAAHHADPALTSSHEEGARGDWKLRDACEQLLWALRDQDDPTVQVSDCMGSLRDALDETAPDREEPNA